jgi:hypothetical protein
MCPDEPQGQIGGIAEAMHVAGKLGRLRVKKAANAFGVFA